MKILNKLLPSSKIKKDIDFNIKYINSNNSIKPLDISELSLITPIKNKILKQRERKKNILIEKSQRKMTLIIPYRHREEHLKKFIPYIVEYLKKQQVDYEIIISEQIDKKPFNRAKLINVAVLNASKKSEYFVFHDVDMLPINIDYRYSNHTQRLYNYIKKENEFEEYKQIIFGGVTLVPKNIFYNINGFSNNYWQWGSEDDDFLLRHLYNGHVPLIDLNGRFEAMPHEISLNIDNEGRKTNDKNILNKNYNYMKKNKQYFTKFRRGLISQEYDGINTLENYKIESKIFIENKIINLKISFD